MNEDFPQPHTPNARKIPLGKRECKTKINKSLQLFFGVVLGHLHEGRFHVRGRSCGCNFFEIDRRVSRAYD